jgi:hypothetical protein
MKSRFIFVFALLFPVLTYGAQHKFFTTHSYSDQNGQHFEFSTQSLTRNSTLSFVRSASNCDVLDVSIRIFDVFPEPSRRRKNKGKFSGEARINYGTPIPFTWRLIFPKNSRDVLIVINKGKLINNLNDGEYINIILFVNGNKNHDTFALEGLAQASANMYNQCIEYNKKDISK